MEEDKCPKCGSPRIEGSMQTSLGVIIGFSCNYLVIKETGEGYYKRPELCKDRQIERLKGLLGEVGDGIASYLVPYARLWRCPECKASKEDKEDTQHKFECKLGKLQSLLPKIQEAIK